MSQETQIILSRDVEAAIVPTGEPVTLKQGEEPRSLKSWVEPSR